MLSEKLPPENCVIHNIYLWKLVYSTEFPLEKYNSKMSPQGNLLSAHLCVQYILVDASSAV